MRRLVYPALMAFALALPLAAHAQTEAQIANLPEGHTLLNISASERTEVMQDTLMASLRVEKKGEDATALQNDINTLIKRALDEAKKAEGVEVSTGQYYVYPNDYHPEPADKTKGPAPVRTWQGGQTIDLKSKDAKALLDLSGKLQGMGLVMGGLNYTLSPQAQEKAKDDLMEGALSKLKARAERAAKALGKTKVELVQVSVDSGMEAQPYMARGAMMEMKAADSMAAPSAEPGQSEITLTVSARALLKP